MTIRWLENKRAYMEDQSLDWLKDYMKENPTAPEQWVMGLIDGDNGILIITHHWKAFLFAKDSRCSQLREAIPVWLTHNEPLPRLIAKPLKGGKFMIGFDDEFVDSYWKEVEPGKYYRQPVDGSTLDIGKDGNGKPSNPNPFLPGSTPAVSTPRRRRNGQRDMQ